MTKKEFRKYCAAELKKITSKPVDPKVTKIFKDAFAEKYPLLRRK